MTKYKYYVEYLHIMRICTSRMKQMLQLTCIEIQDSASLSIR